MNTTTPSFNPTDARAIDGTPDYPAAVTTFYRSLQLRTSIFTDLPERGTGIRLGVYQAEAAFGPGASEKNMQRLENAVQQAALSQVQLLAFPELYVPGYTLSPDEVQRVAEPPTGASITRACRIAKANRMALILPYAELDATDPEQPVYYDSIAIINEQGNLLDSYRKTHLYGQQERDNWTPGNGPFLVHQLCGFPVGVLNCYECEFPELSRILAVKGAKLIVGPTAADSYYRLPSGVRSAVPYPDVAKTVLQANAYTNNVFFAYVNRCGFEMRDGDYWHYRGNSIVYGPHGDILAEAAHEQDSLLIADCIPACYGMTHPAPDYYYLKDRRPECYGPLTAPPSAPH